MPSNASIRPTETTERKNITIFPSDYAVLQSLGGGDRGAAKGLRRLVAFYRVIDDLLTPAQVRKVESFFETID